LFPPDDERLSLETCRGRKINTLKKVKKVRQVGCKSRSVSAVELFPRFVSNHKFDYCIHKISLFDPVHTS
jgi:hypothetical protein